MDNAPQRSSHSPSSSTRPSWRVDAHHHLWRYSPEEFAWLDDDMSSLRRDFLMKDFLVTMGSASVDGTVVVQARPTLEETRWLLACARSNATLWGVVGWLPLDVEGLADVVEGLDPADKLVGARELVQDRPDGFLDREVFHRGMDELTKLDLTYDLLIHERQLEETIRFVDRHPLQRFVLDHAAKPKIAAGDLEPWRTMIRALGRRPSVVCKLSGLATEAIRTEWTLDTLRPYLDVCVEAFGPDRLMVGSDWPVCLAATEYARWWKTLEEYFQDFSDDETRRIFGETAIECYKLSLSPEVQS